MDENLKNDIDHLSVNLVEMNAPSTLFQATKVAEIFTRSLKSKSKKSSSSSKSGKKSTKSQKGTKSNKGLKSQKLASIPITTFPSAPISIMPSTKSTFATTNSPTSAFFFNVTNSSTAIPTTNVTFTQTNYLTMLASKMNLSNFSPIDFFFNATNSSAISSSMAPSDFPSAVLASSPSTHLSLAPNVSVMSFDDLDFSSEVLFVPNGYRGFDFSYTLFGVKYDFFQVYDYDDDYSYYNASVYDQINTGLEKGCVSVPNVAVFNGYLHITSIEDGTFTVASLYIASLLNYNVSVLFEGRGVGGELVVKQTAALSSEDEARFVVLFGFENLTHFEIHSKDNLLVMDDIVIYHD